MIYVLCCLSAEFEKYVQYVLKSKECKSYKLLHVVPTGLKRATDSKCYEQNEYAHYLELIK